VQIPAGVESGTRLCIRGEGEPLADGPAGDLYVDVFVAEDDIFQRHGSDIVCEVPIAYSTAALGGQIEVPTLEGESHSLRVPAGTQSDTVLRIPQSGLPHVGNARRGDLLVRVVIETPRKLTDRQEELLRELAEIEHANVSERRKGFVERIKSYLSGSDTNGDQG
jgi:molecular chaperone DnaJ